MANIFSAAADWSRAGIRYTSLGDGFEYAGQLSENYIRRYTMSSHEEKEATLEVLFG